MSLRLKLNASAELSVSPTVYVPLHHRGKVRNAGATGVRGVSRREEKTSLVSDVTLVTRAE